MPTGDLALPNDASATGSALSHTDADDPVDPEPGEPADGAAANPAWAGNLRDLYDAVLKEPLPDSFLDLLSQLDAED